MNLQEAKEFADASLKKHKLDIKGWRFEFDTATRRFGACFYSKKLITISTDLTELNSEEQVKDTILHEIAHALCKPEDHHNFTWETACMITGAIPKACYSSETVICSKEAILLQRASKLDALKDFKL